MGSSLDSVSDKLRMLPSSITEFEKSINELTFSSNSQAERLKNTTEELNSSVGELTKSIFEYKQFIDDYGEQLSEVISVTDTQLMIWKDQQKILLSEFSRKPILNVKKLNCSIAKDTIRIEGFTIENKGEIEAEIQSIHIEYITNYKHITQQCFEPYRQNKKRYLYHCGLFNSIPNSGMSIYFESVCNVNTENKYKIEIAYKSKYESNVFEKTIDLSDCKNVR